MPMLGVHKALLPDCISASATMQPQSAALTTKERALASPLSDLDELVLKCRDEKAKNYIREAVSCYKSGAFRSAIVSTWVAVAFDIIDKLKDLSLAGDKEAEKQLDEFEKARKAGDIAKSLKFERDILQISRDKLELISHVEYIDLERLQQDRNRCAHPSMTSDSEIFKPSAELARVHIRSAVEHLLQYPPAQGKSALEGLIKEVDSQYFPADVGKALTSLKNSPIYRARETLVRNFVVVLLKKMLSDPEDYKKNMQLASALSAISKMYNAVFDSTLTDKLSNIVKTIEDEDLHRVFDLLRNLSESWEYLDDDVKQKIQSYVESLPKGRLEELYFLLPHKGLQKAAKKRVRFASRSELNDALFFDLPEEVAERIVKLFSESSSFDQANSFSPVVTRYASDFNANQVENIVKSCGDNFEIRNSFEVGSVINSLRKNKNVSETEFNDLLRNAGLKEYAKSESEEPEDDG